MGSYEHAEQFKETDYRKIVRLLKQLHPDHVSTQIGSETGTLARVLTSLLDSDEVQKHKSAPTAFSRDFQGKHVVFAGQMSDKAIRATRPYTLTSPSAFLNDLDVFLKTGALPKAADAPQKPNVAEKPETASNRLNHIAVAIKSLFGIGISVSDGAYSEERVAILQVMRFGLEAAHVYMGGDPKEVYKKLSIVISGRRCFLRNQSGVNLVFTDSGSSTSSTRDSILKLMRQNNPDWERLEKETGTIAREIEAKYGATIAQPLMPRATMEERIAYLKTVRTGLAAAALGEEGDVMVNERVVDVSELPKGAHREAYFDPKDLTLYVLRTISDSSAIPYILKKEQERRRAGQAR